MPKIWLLTNCLPLLGLLLDSAERSAKRSARVLYESHCARNGWPAKGELTFNDFLIIKAPLRIPRNQFYLF